MIPTSMLLRVVLMKWRSNIDGKYGKEMVVMYRDNGLACFEIIIETITIELQHNVFAQVQNRKTTEVVKLNGLIHHTVASW